MLYGIGLLAKQFPEHLTAFHREFVVALPEFLLRQTIYELDISLA